MLVLSRKAGQKIVLMFEGREIVVSVEQIRGDKIRLGFVADSEVQIMREELLEPKAA